MKKCLLVLFIIVVFIMSSACGETRTLDDKSEEASSVTPAGAQTPTQTPTPDFSAADFSGTWDVAEIIDSEGKTASQQKMRDLGADFSLELLDNGAYFVYNENGAVLGQGVYSVSKNQLTLAAGEEESIYEINDNDTFCCTAADNSITVMKRAMEESGDIDCDTNDSDDTTDAQDDTNDSDDITDAQDNTNDSDDTTDAQDDTNSDDTTDAQDDTDDRVDTAE